MELPKRSVAVTFDDGYADNFHIAAPIMERFGISAAVYVNVEATEIRSLPWYCRLKFAFANTAATSWRDLQTDLIYMFDNGNERADAFRRCAELCARHAGEDQLRVLEEIENDLNVTPPSACGDSIMLSADEMRRLLEMGHIIGSHALTHPNLAYISMDGLHREVTESKSRLEKLLGIEVKHFSYPSPILEPHWNRATVSACVGAGYSTAVTCTPGVVVVGGNPLAIRRTAVPNDLDDFVWTIETNFVRSNYSPAVPGFTVV